MYKKAAGVKCVIYYDFRQGKISSFFLNILLNNYQKSFMFDKTTFGSNGVDYQFKCFLRTRTKQ